MKRFLMTIIVVITIPFFVTKFFVRTEKVYLKHSSKKMIKVKNELNGEIMEIPFEEYIVGVIAGEMPASYDIEALKAQAVASRSYALFHMTGGDFDVTNTTSSQVYLTQQQQKDKWKGDYDKNLRRIEKAVIDTEGEYLTYNGEIVNAMFFAVSTGNTENSEDVFVSKLPYLRSVSSSWDQKSPVFSDSVSMNINDFYSSLGIQYNDSIKVDIIEKTRNGRIKKLKINGSEFKGRDIASKLKLRSNYFEIIQNGNKVIINTKGYGHGVGMSQFGANEMAKEGNDYKKILAHYYFGTEIKS